MACCFSAWFENRSLWSSEMFFHGLQRRLLSLSRSAHSRPVSTSETPKSSSSRTKETRRKEAEKSPSSMADYLVNSLGFSRGQAISASTKTRELKSDKNAISVIGFLKSLGLDDGRIKSSIANYPSLLNRDVDETLAPRIRALQDLGLPVSSFTDFLAYDVEYIKRNFTSVILPKVEVLRSVLGSSEHVSKVLRQSKWLVYGNIEHMRGNLMLLQQNGVSIDRTKQLVIHFLRYLFYSCELFEEGLVKVEQVLGIKPDSPMFVYAIPAVLIHGEEGLRTKFEVFKSYGWSDADVAELARKQPAIFGVSCNLLGSKLNFLMKELGYRPEYILAHLCLLTLSLEKRILPRFAVFRVLKEKKLLKSNYEFYKVLVFNETRFLSELVLPYRDMLPQIYEAYVDKRTYSVADARN